MRCSRVGLAVFVESPARSVRARVDGLTVTLRTPSHRRGRYGTGRFWQVFFRDPRMQALANASRSTPVRIEVRMRSGGIRSITRLVYVSEGYG